MRLSKLFFVSVLLAFSLAGCQQAGCATQGASVPTGGEGRTASDTVVVGDRVFTIDEINAGIKETFNNRLYLTGYAGLCSTEDLLYKDIEYELYFKPDDGSNRNTKYYWLDAPAIYLAITNIQHPRLTEAGSTQFYMLGIHIDEKGLQSGFNFATSGPKQGEGFFSNCAVVYLGSYTMRIDGLERPQYEAMDAEWVERTEDAIRLYMDYDYSNPNIKKLLGPGSYQVYVKGFFKGDTNSTIIFVHEDGPMYIGSYRYVREGSGDRPANLHKVSPVEDPGNERFQAYLEKVRLDAVISMEYTIE
jgi:hypothetical protein